MIDFSRRADDSSKPAYKHEHFYRSIHQHRPAAPLGSQARLQRRSVFLIRRSSRVYGAGTPCHGTAFEIRKQPTVGWVARIPPAGGNPTVIVIVMHAAWWWRLAFTFLSARPNEGTEGVVEHREKDHLRRPHVRFQAVRIF